MMPMCRLKADGAGGFESGRGFKPDFLSLSHPPKSCPPRSSEPIPNGLFKPQPHIVLPSPAAGNSFYGEEAGTG